MEQFEDETSVPSPCVGICRMNARTGLCEGCTRSIDEIRQWSRATNDEKRAIWELITLRRLEAM
jgi:hypothetical protein